MRQIDALRKEIEAIEDVNRADFEALRQLGFSPDPGTTDAGTAANHGQPGAPVDHAGPPAAPGKSSEPEELRSMSSILPVR